MTLAHKHGYRTLQARRLQAPTTADGVQHRTAVGYTVRDSRPVLALLLGKVVVDGTLHLSRLLHELRARTGGGLLESVNTPISTRRSHACELARCGRYCGASDVARWGRVSPSRESRFWLLTARAVLVRTRPCMVSFYAEEFVAGTHQDMIIEILGCI